MPTVYKKTALTGGAAGALDAVDGIGLLNSDLAFVTVAGIVYIYILDDSVGGAESSPTKITPDANAGNKRWVLQTEYNANVGAGNLTTHIADTTTAHGAVSAATASKIAMRDASGRAQFVAPSVAADAATRGYVDALTLPVYKNLKITTIGAANNQSVLLTADYVVVQDTGGLAKRLATFSKTCTLSGSGVDGLDTGSLAANTGYFLWVIYNPTSDLMASLASLSATSPTMPSGYTYKALIGWCTTDETTTPFNIEEFTQTDDRYHWSIPQKVLDTGTAASATAVDLGTAGIKGYATVPPSLTKDILIRGTSYHNWGFINPVTFTTISDLAAEVATPTVHYIIESVSFATTPFQITLPMIEAQTLYYHTTASGSVYLSISGFTLKR